MKAEIPELQWRRIFTELVIIVVGVLIALGIGDARQAFKERAMEQEYLQRLETDLLADLDEIERVARHSERRADHAYKAIGFLKADDIVQISPEMIGDFNRAGYITFFAHARSTWDDLEGTGNLNLLRDEDLRQSLGRYYSSTRFLEEFDQSKINQVWHDYRLELDRHISPLTLMAVARAEDPGAEDLSTIDVEGMRLSSNLHLKLEKIIAMAEVEIRMNRNISEQTNELLAVVRSQQNSG